MLSGCHCSPKRFRHHLRVKQVWERCIRKHPPGSQESWAPSPHCPQSATECVGWYRPPWLLQSSGVQKGAEKRIIFPYSHPQVSVCPLCPKLEVLLSHLGRDRGFQKPLLFPGLSSPLSHSNIIFTIQGDFQLLWNPGLWGPYSGLALVPPSTCTEHQGTCSEGCKLLVGPACPPQLCDFLLQRGPHRDPQQTPESHCPVLPPNWACSGFCCLSEALSIRICLESPLDLVSGLLIPTTSVVSRDEVPAAPRLPRAVQPANLGFSFLSLFTVSEGKVFLN